MKTYVAPFATPAKRRWKWLTTAVLALVLFSLLVPLAFLLGVHNRFPSGHLSFDRSTLDSGFRGYGKAQNGHEKTFPQEAENNLVGNGKTRETQAHLVLKGGTLSNTQVQDDIFHPKDLPTPQVVMPKTLTVINARNTNEEGDVGTMTPIQELNTNKTQNPFETEYRSYCINHKRKITDNLVKKLKSQLFLARAYYPSISKLPNQENFSHEIRQHIQDHERMLSAAEVDADLPIFVKKKIQKMEKTISKAKSFNVDCNNVHKKLAQILNVAEDEARFYMRQGAFLYHLDAQTIPKGLHCLTMRLTVEYFKDPSSVDAGVQQVGRLENPDFHHYVIFSQNVLASSVTVNSTVMNAKVSKNVVFHLLTDDQNYYAMKFWFSKNSYREAIIHVLNIENLGLNISCNSKLQQTSFSEEYRVSALQIRTEYISIFGHTHFLLPDIFKNLKKIVVLDDDVVVQQDLSPLWGLDLKGKVNGAVHFCKVKLGQLKHYLGSHNFNGDSCIWMSGLNIVDLEKWREHDITSTYAMLRKEVDSKKMASLRGAALPISLLAFQDMIYPLEDKWVLSGLGKEYDISKDYITKAAVLHYSGNLKPWLELGIPKYKWYWRNFLTRDDRFMDECNANP